MKLYRVTYTDETDRGCPELTTRIRAANTRHAAEQFLDSESDGWRIVKIERVRED